MRHRFGDALRPIDEPLLERVVERGRIRNADEYRVISERVEAIHADPAHRDERLKLNRLLEEAAARPGKLADD